MLVIKTEEFFPIADDKDFKVTLKPLSFLGFKQVQIAMNSNVPSGGPDKADPTPQGEIDFVQKLFEKAVLKIDGFVYEGQMVLDQKIFLDLAPTAIVIKIWKKVLEISTPSDAEVKN